MQFLETVIDKMPKANQRTFANIQKFFKLATEKDLEATGKKGEKTFTIDQLVVLQMKQDPKMAKALPSFARSYRAVKVAQKAAAATEATAEKSSAAKKAAAKKKADKKK